MIITDIENESGTKYEIVYSDPPWQQVRGTKLRVRPNSSGRPLDYPTMTLSEIEQFHYDFLSTRTENKHNVFLWVIEKYLVKTITMMETMGYVKHCIFTWDKITGPPAGFTVRFSTEYLIWFYRPGHILRQRRECMGKYSTCIRERARKHSQKPESAYLMLEDMFPTERKIELFARNIRNGWDSFGNEVK